MDLEEARAKLIAQLKTYHSNSAPQIDAFFSRVQIQAAAGGFAMLTSDNAFIKNWIEDHYTDDIRQAMSELYGGDNWIIQIEVDTTQASEASEATSTPAVAESPKKSDAAKEGAPKLSETKENPIEAAPQPLPQDDAPAMDKPEQKEDQKPTAPPKNKEATAGKSPSRSQVKPSEYEQPAKDESTAEETEPKEKPAEPLQPRRTTTGETKLTFGNFVAGASNQMAYSMAVEVADKPGNSALNPLFIYGRSGVGKTHLLCAIRNYLEEHYPTLKVRYIDAMEMVNEYSNAAITKSFRSFEESFRELDVLLIDDIQALQGKQQTLDTLFRIFNELIPKGKQFVFSADRAPKNIDLDERYVSRFNSGATIDVHPPDAETKRNIAKSFLMECQEDEDFPLELTDDVLDYIAENSSSNVRELKSAVTNVVFALKLDPEHKVTKQQVKQMLSNHFASDTSNKVTMDAIKDAICSFYGVSDKELTGPGRSKKIKLPRSVAIYLCREMLDCTFAAIGDGFGRAHSTIMHSYEVISEQINEDRNLREEVEAIREKLRVE
ncbi:MAG: chromosomal replication initiator protein DnaA [Coriobacteriia bacterium]|nr:chromosomal replication initiator protein DnaA [Coriobacteriia bacterium]